MLRNVEECRGDEHCDGIPERGDREGLRRGQIVTVLFVNEHRGAPEPAGVVILENRNDAYVGQLLDPADAEAHSPSGRIEFGAEHVGHLFDGCVPIGTQQISHYEAEIALGIDDVRPEDLRRLRFFPYLYRLSLPEGVEDLAFLSDVPALEVLDVDGTSVSDLSPVRALDQLNTLFAARTRVEDLEPLSSLHDLEGLRLSYAPVDDLTPIRNLRALKYLNIGCTKITTMPALAGLPSLEVVDVSGTAISDLSWVAECSSLKTLNALASYFDSLAPLRSATELQRLTLSVHPAADFSALHDLTKLVYVGVLVHEDERVEPAQEEALGELVSRGVDVHRSDSVDELVDLLSPAIH